MISSTSQFVCSTIHSQISTLRKKSAVHRNALSNVSPFLSTVNTLSSAIPAPTAHPSTAASNLLLAYSLLLTGSATPSFVGTNSQRIPHLSRSSPSTAPSALSSPWLPFRVLPKHEDPRSALQALSLFLRVPSAKQQSSPPSV